MSCKRVLKTLEFQTFEVRSVLGDAFEVLVAPLHKRTANRRVVVLVNKLRGNKHKAEGLAMHCWIITYPLAHFDPDALEVR